MSLEFALQYDCPLRADYSEPHLRHWGRLSSLHAKLTTGDAVVPSMDKLQWVENARAEIELGHDDTVAVLAGTVERVRHLAWGTVVDILGPTAPLQRTRVGSAYTGQTESDVRGAGWAEALHPEDRERVLAAWQQAIAGKGLFDLEYRIRSSAGDYRPFQCRAVPIANSSTCPRACSHAQRRPPPNRIRSQTEICRS